MTALLAEPFPLTSYPAPSQKYPQSKESGQSKRRRYVSATCSSSGHGEGFVTISVQGDGVHVLELSNMHASVSHTLGPSAFFAAPAVTRFDSLEASTSYAVMQSAPDGMKPEERGRTVWRWKDRQSRRPEEPVEPKHSAVFPWCVEHIWAPSGLPSYVIAVSPSGQIMLADEDLNLTSSNEVPDANSTLVKAWVFGPEECAFLPHRSDSLCGLVVLCFVTVGKHVNLRITFVQTTGKLKDVADCDLGVQENVTDISCDPSGYTSILTQRGEWQFFRLRLDTAGIVIATPLDGPLHLTGLSLPVSSGGENRVMSGPSVLSVGSSYVLLAGIVGGAMPEVALLLWDLQYSVVLASQNLALPSTLAYTPKNLPSLELVPASKTQALLVLSSAVPTGTKHDASTAQTRSTILIIPLEVPPMSTIALAMGKARDTQKWLQSTHGSSFGGDQDQGREKMVQTIRQALEQSRPQAAEVAFFAWIEEETNRLKQLKETDGASGDREDIQLDSDEGTEPDTEHKTPGVKRKWKKAPTKPALSHHFVSTILNMVLQSSKTSDVPYSSKIVFYLVDRKAVGHAMVEGGILPALRLRRDWESITSALRNVPDIPETDLVMLLADVVASHRQRREVQDDSMQVDAPADIPPLVQYLAALATYATSPPVLRLALKQHLTDTRDVMCLLEILDEWVARWCEKNMGLTPTLGPPSTNSSQLTLPIDKKKVRPSRNGRMPPFEQVTSFLQSLLDTHFLALLQYSPSHSVLERLAQHLHRQLASVDDLDRLRGPVEAFVRIQSKQARSTKAKKEGEGDWRKKRKEFEAAELAVGLYQIEELAI